MENQIVIYQTDNGQTAIDVRLENETVWLTQAQMAELFQKDRTVIGRHISNVFKEGELDEKVVCANFAHTTQQMKKTTLSKAVLGKSIRLLAVKTYIRAWKRKRPCCCISSPRTIRSATATNALRPHCSCGSSTTTASSTARMAASA